LFYFLGVSDTRVVPRIFGGDGEYPSAYAIIFLKSVRIGHLAFEMIDALYSPIIVP